MKVFHALYILDGNLRFDFEDKYMLQFLVDNYHCR